jgi:protein-disulfide isomerase
MESVMRLPANEFDHHRGPLSAEVVLIQYGDYECPYSALLARDLDLLKEEFRDSLCHVYRHFPEFSEIAALASEAAGEQNKFWEVHGLLFENSEDLSADLIRLVVRKAGLDMNQFENDMQRFDLYDKVRNDYKNAVEAGIKSTPTVYLNGVLYQDSYSYWPLKEAIELAKNNFRSATF